MHLEKQIQGNIGLTQGKYIISSFYSKMNFFAYCASGLTARYSLARVWCGSVADATKLMSTEKHQMTGYVVF